MLFWKVKSGSINSGYNYVQECNNNVARNNALTQYKEIKLSFEFETYIDKSVSINLRSCITKLRLCAHHLEYTMEDINTLIEMYIIVKFVPFIR